MKRLLLSLSILLLLAAPASAQGAGITSFNLRQYLPGASAPVVAAFSIPVSAVQCNQVLPTSPVHQALWDDPDNPGKVCIYTDPGTGPLFAKVYGALEATLTNLAGTLEGPESNRASFLRPPVAPTSLKVVR